ncbi:MAG TPA: Ig-like domain-containing protein [Euzebyales bacterium]|nr:Ig-like domain-containing protein [Euzebyales bacterium]
MGVVVALWGTVATGAGTPRAAAAAPVRPSHDAQEVQTVWTGELGVAHPVGLAYDPSRRQFLVAADDGTVTPVLRLDADGKGRGTLTLPELSDPETLAFNAARDELTVIDGGDAVQVPDSALDGRTPRTERAPIDGLQLEEPDSATFDPQTDTWFVLDERDDAVTVVEDDRSSPSAQLPLDQSDDRLIAFNAEDDLLYVLDPSSERIDAVDRDGDVRDSIDLASTALSEPVAMTFAPSTDSTDDPDNLNLYVADAGGAGSLGGVTELSLAAVTAAAAPTDTATLVRTVQTSAWSPGSPDPAGVVWTAAADELVVVDSEVDETTGAGWHNVNLWRSSRTGTVRGVGALWGPGASGNHSREPTGLGHDDATRTLFVSDDSARAIFAVRRGADGVFGTGDDDVRSIDTSANGGTDTEDPEFDPRSGDLFYVDGVGMEIYRVDPVDGTFANGNDAVTHFDISHLGPVDFEGLSSDPDRGTLYVGARKTRQIFEITRDGTLVRTISASAVAGLRHISGLAVAPASDGSGRMNLWIVDRATDNGTDPTENDGRMFEISAPNIGGGKPANRPPVASDDAASTAAVKPVTIPLLANDSDPDGDQLTVHNLTQPAHGSVQVRADQTVVYTPDLKFAGTDTFTYRANDGRADSNVATVTVTVTSRPKIELYRIAYNPPGRDTRTNAKLNEEMVVLRNIGSEGRGIGGWTVRDRAGNLYKVPGGFFLKRGGYVRVHTGKGTNDGNDLYWRRTRYVWNNGGDRATLKNARGQVRDRCEYSGGGWSVRC